MICQNQFETHTEEAAAIQGQVLAGNTVHFSLTPSTPWLPALPGLRMKPRQQFWSPGSMPRLGRLQDLDGKVRNLGTKRNQN